MFDAGTLPISLYRTRPLNVAVSPVSGGALTSQLGIFQGLADARMDFDVLFGSSGGNVANWVFHASDMNSRCMETIVRDFQPSMFCRPWFAISAFLSLAHGYSQEGALFREGEGGAAIWNKYFATPAQIIKREVWIGTYNYDRNMTQFFCNRSPRDSLFGNCHWDNVLTQCLDPVFMGGKLDLIDKACLASASIPQVVPPQEIYGQYYQDGGVTCSSPMTYMKQFLITLPEVHVTYVNCCDLSKKEYRGDCMNSTSGSLMAGLTRTRDAVMKSMMVQDRISAHELLQMSSFLSNKEINFERFQFNPESLRRIIEIKRHSSKSLLEIYPMISQTIDITCFKPEDILQQMQIARANSFCNLWYIRDK